MNNLGFNSRAQIAVWMASSKQVLIGVRRGYRKTQPKLTGMSPANRSGIGKLPTESTSFVGRRRLLTEVKRHSLTRAWSPWWDLAALSKCPGCPGGARLPVVITTPLGDRFLDFIGKPKTV